MVGSARFPRRQRGWVGIIVLLLALLIVAVLAQTVLKQSGLLGGFDQSSTSARPGDAGRGPGVIAPASVDATAATPTPANALERARGVESTVQKQAQDLGKQIDDEAK
ncbi:MAG: hypothetical protein E6H67_00590 [Betaproteobacteria bacterium]|nr:MAG: hypothetical protein E6H67_00590 [Betaproteobacteria bacterium]